MVSEVDTSSSFSLHENSPEDGGFTLDSDEESDYGDSQCSDPLVVHLEDGIRRQSFIRTLNGHVHLHLPKQAQDLDLVLHGV